MNGISPTWGTLLNAALGIFGVLESTGVVNVLTTSGGKAGAIAATVIAGGNMLLHAMSSNEGGVLTADPAPQTQAMSGAVKPK